MTRDAARGGIASSLSRATGRPLAALLLLLWLPLAGCLSNPTPHPEVGDAFRGPDTAVGQTDDDSDKTNGGGADAITETPSGSYDGADVVVGDVDPNASVDDDAWSDASDARDDGGASSEDDEDAAATPSEPDQDNSGCVGGGHPPIHGR